MVLMRSQGGADSVENLVLLTGSGTTGEHGWVHAHPAAAVLLGLIVPPHLDPAEWPIWRVGSMGTTRGWHLQGSDGSLRRIRIAEVLDRQRALHFVLESWGGTAHQVVLSIAVAQVRAVIAAEGGDRDD